MLLITPCLPTLGVFISGLLGPVSTDDTTTLEFDATGASLDLSLFAGKDNSEPETTTAGSLLVCLNPRLESTDT